MRLSLLSLFLLTTIYSHSQDGTPDPSFGNNGLAIYQPGLSHDNAQDIVALADGKILIAGVTDTGSFDFAAIVGRLNADGTIDETFGTAGWYTLDMGGGSDYFYEMVVLADGSILLCGAYSVTPANTDVMVAKLNSDGTPDMSFGGGDGLFTHAISPGEEYLHDLTVLSDGSILVCGSATTPTFNVKGLTMKLSAAGELDTTFGSNGYVFSGSSGDNSDYWGITTDDQGNILVSGFADISFQYYMLLSKLDAAGDPVETFGDNGHVVSENKARGYDVAFHNNRILVCGMDMEFGDFNAMISAFNTDGTTDNSFGVSGAAIANLNPTDLFLEMVVDGNGKITAAGSSGPGVPNNLDFFATRFNADGSPDNTFGTSGNFIQSIGDMWEEINAVTIDNDGNTLVAGFLAANNTDMAVMRLGIQPTNGIGELSSSFYVYPNPANDFIYVQSDNLSAGSSLTLYDAMGKVVYQSGLNSAFTNISVKEFAPGLYTIRIGSESRLIIIR